MQRKTLRSILWITVILLVTALFATRVASALTVFNVQQGGTGVGTVTGIIKGNGTAAFSGLTGTSNQITYWSDANTIGSLTTATYPSLTELSYVKGVTSSIQTQLNALATPYTLAGVSALSTDATKSLYTMTSSVPVEFRSSDGNTILYIDETNERINIGGTTHSYVAPLQITSAVSGPGGFNTGLVLRGAAPGIVFEDTSSNDAMIGVENGDMFFYTGSTASTPMFAIRPGQPNTIFYMNTIWGTDNTYDIGASGASRPRTGYFGTSIIAGATGSTGRVDLKRSSDGTTVGSLIAQTSSINLQGNTVTIGVNTTNGIYHATNGTWMGKGSISNSAPTALVHIPTTGSTAANNGQFKLESQTVLATSEAGLLENDGTHLYFTFANGGARYQLDQQSGTPGGSNKQFQYNNSSAFAGSANLTQETNQILITASSTSVIPLVVQSTSSSQTSSLFEVQRYDGVAGLAVSATTEVTLGGSYDYVNAKHAAQHTVRYANSGYSGAGLKLQNLSSGSIVRLHSFNNGLYLTNDTGTAAPMTLGTRVNPGDSSTFIASAGRWIIDSGAFVVNKSAWSGNNQFEVTSTARPQLALFYDTSNYLSTTINSTGSATFDLTGTSPTFTFSKGVSISGTLALGANSLTMTGSIAATGARVTKGWFTDIESTNMPTVGGVGILTSLTAPQFTTIELGHASDTTLARVSAGVISVEGITVPTISSTNTLTNKRITARIGTTTSSSTPTPDADANDQYNVTALATGATFGAPTGTPTDGQKLIIRIKDNGGAQTLAWNSIYRFSSDMAAPTTTVVSKTFYLGFIYNAADSKWDNVSQLNNF